MEISQLELAEFDELMDLVRVVHAHDGVQLKLELPYVRRQATVASLICRDAGALKAFIGIYAFSGPPDVELVGMVDPHARRQGWGTQLLEAALAICAEHQLTRRLLVVPRQSDAAQAFARRHGGTLHHSEYSLSLTGEPRRAPEDPATTIRDASTLDRAALMRILTAGFGATPTEALDRLHGDTFRTVIVEHRGEPIGTARLSLVDGFGAIHGFAVDTEFRGRGIGRDVLGRFCAMLREQGASKVGLEVEVDNELALGLYTSTGFTEASTDDYFRLPA